jgi:hypothetical protein
MCKLHYVIDAADRIFIENQFVETVCVYRFKKIHGFRRFSVQLGSVGFLSVLYGFFSYGNNV